METRTDRKGLTGSRKCEKRREESEVRNGSEHEETNEEGKKKERGEGSKW